MTVDSPDTAATRAMEGHRMSRTRAQPGDSAVDSRPPPPRPPQSLLIGQSQSTGRGALSPPQRRVLDAIIDFTTSHGHPPTVRDICRQAELASTSTVAYHLKVLATWGYIRRDPALARAIVVLREPSRPA